MKTAIVNFIGQSLYSQSKPHRTAKLERETAEDYEARTWKERMHVNGHGEIVMPAMAIKNCIAEAGKYLSMQIPGKGKSTYTKHIESGLLILENSVIYGQDGEPLRKDDCDREGSQIYGDWIFTPSDGVPGSGKRVYRCYPVIRGQWGFAAAITIADEIITQPVLEKHLMVAGNLIGLGRFRLRNRGTYGRFSTEIVSWGEAKIA